MAKAPGSAPRHSVGVVSRSVGSYADRSTSLRPAKSGGSRIGGNVGDQSVPKGTAESMAKRFPRLNQVMSSGGK